MGHATAAQRTQNPFYSFIRLVFFRLGTVLALALLASLATWAQTVEYSGPIVITAGGIYSGNWESLDSTVPAVDVQTTQTVIIENSNIRSAGHVINVRRNGNVTVVNSRGYGLLPSTDNRPHGRFVNARLPAHLVIENNYFENTSGIYVHEFLGDGSLSQTIRIRYNKARNINGKHRNGTQRALVSFVQFNEVIKTANMEIAWNDLLNEPGASAVEDNINLFNTSGTADSPLLVHNNFIKGAYPLNPLASSYSGGGILTDGKGTGDKATAYIHAYENVVINTTNHGMGIAAGNNVEFFHNRVISSGLFADGTQIPAQFSGIWMRNYYNAPPEDWYNNANRNNVLAWVKFGLHLEGQEPDRQDISHNRCENCPDNVSLPNPVLLDLELQEYRDWQQRCRQANVKVGLVNPTTQALSVVVSSPSDNASFKEGSAIGISATVTAVTQSPPRGNSQKTTQTQEVSVKRVDFFRGSFKIGEATSSPYSINWNGAPVGTHQIRAVALDENWTETTSEAISITVLANQPPVVSAGGNKSITLPTNSLMLSGSASDPDGTVAGVLWTQQSGATATLSGQTSTTLSLSNLTDGTYVFRLTATDNDGASAFDEATVTVAPQPANQAPVVSLTAPAHNSTHTQGTAITLSASASDPDGTINRVEFFAGTTRLGERTATPYSLSWTGATLGTHTLTAVATDNAGAQTTSAPVTIQVVASSTWQTGSISREFWANAPGARVSDIPLTKTPTSTNQLTIFEGPTNIAHNYGTRIRGYVHPPATGNYTFWIAGDDHCELWLSTDDNPDNKKRIAHHQGQTRPREWTKFSTQQSAPIPLENGRRYYIEALHKEDRANDNIAVGWQLPNSTFERPIPGNRLSPFVASTSLSASSSSNAVSIQDYTSLEAASSKATVSPNPNTGLITLWTLADKGSPTTVSLTDLTGREVYRTLVPAGEEEIHLPLDLRPQNLAPGVYLLRVQTGSRSEVLRVVKNQ
jgi:hypothetical protein